MPEPSLGITRPTRLEISLSNFQYNIDRIRDCVGPGVELMPVIKANAYGTHINQRLEVINQFGIVAVATVDEAVALRRLGFTHEIFVLNQPYETEIGKIALYNVTVGISSLDFAHALAAAGTTIRVHLEIGTGMGRTGIHPRRVEEYLGKIPRNVVVDGIYTHFSAADTDDGYTHEQLRSFNRAVEAARALSPTIRHVHAAASNALLNYPESRFNLVRPGLIMYGYPSAEDTLERIELRPVASLKSRITFIKEVKEGTSIGYGRSFVTTRPTVVATVPIGYADGLRRTFSNGWPVLVRGRKAPIIGKICMDSFMVDVTDLADAALGDEVAIWDNEHITLDDLARKCDTISYEILSQVGERVPRCFV
ncbi:MAG: alanine racemase [Succinivibrionaceae bacterium]|nr:alanine racemase [Succinivibrionaceae bacterium]